MRRLTIIFDQTLVNVVARRLAQETIGNIQPSRSQVLHQVPSQKRHQANQHHQRKKLKSI